MDKSRRPNLDSAHDDPEGTNSVSGTAVGSRVLVNGRFPGTLLYLGPVEGKAGLFCGVEMDQRLGKNDGSHQGIRYFECRPGHGVFAPCHKVQLQSQHQQGRPAGMDCSGWALSQSLCQSTMSTGSTDSGGDWTGTSSLTASKLLEDDPMAHSHATYTVFESECLMLSDLELTDSAALLRLDDDEFSWAETYGNGNWCQTESMGLEEANLLMDSALPALGEEDESTPMVESRDWPSATHLECDEREVGGGRRSQLGLEGLLSGGKRHKWQNNNNDDGDNARRVVESEAEDSVVTDRRNNNERMGGVEEREGSCPSPGTEHGSSKRPRKPRVSVFQSTPPVQNLSAAARAKPKGPSKSQLLMEQMKASIEAEKQRPRKEIRSRVQAGPTAREKGAGEDSVSTPMMGERPQTRAEGQDYDESSESEAELMQNHKLRKESLQMQTGKAEAAATKSRTLIPHTTISNSNLPRTRAHQIPVRSSASVLQVSATRSRNASVTNLSINQTNKSSAAERSTASSRPVLSSKENTGGTVTATKRTHQPAATSTSSSSIKQRQISTKCSSNDSVGRFAKVGGRAAKTTKAVLAQNNPADTALIVAKKQAEANEKKAHVFVILSWHLSNQVLASCEQTNRLKLSMDRALDAVERGWQAKVQQTIANHQHEIDQLRNNLYAEHQNQLQRMQQLHQRNIEESNQETETLKEQMKEMAQRHAAQQGESKSERISRIKKELESREYELHVKKEELDNLKKENRELQFMVDQIPEKNGQINRLEAKNVELREQVNRLKQIERKLLHQIDECRHQLNDALEKREMVFKEKEVLEYHLHERGILSNQSTPRTHFAKESCMKPSMVRTPEQRRKSVERPYSSCLPQAQGRQTTQCGGENDHDMTRSADSALTQSVIEFYRREGKGKQQNTPDRIYTSKEYYEIKDNSQPSAKRFVYFGSSAEDVHNPKSSSSSFDCKE